jgi:hypothetical protein
MLTYLKILISNPISLISTGLAGIAFPLLLVPMTYGGLSQYGLIAKFLIIIFFLFTLLTFPMPLLNIFILTRKDGKDFISKHGRLIYYGCVAINLLGTLLFIGLAMMLFGMNWTIYFTLIIPQSAWIQAARRRPPLIRIFISSIARFGLPIHQAEGLFKSPAWISTAHRMPPLLSISSFLHSAASAV